MKNSVTTVAMVLGLAVLLAGCGGKYSDIISLNKSFTGLMESYAGAMEKAQNAEDVAAAINKFADGMEPLVPKMKAMREKYPELEDPANLPEDLKQSQQETEAVSRRYADSFMKMMPYMADPQVQAAQMRLSQVMSRMGEE
ncbi:MAG: hypothetical protein ACOZBW_06065 [Thermodesulfobacteriota bacterium]